MQQVVFATDRIGPDLTKIWSDPIFSISWTDPIRIRTDLVNFDPNPVRIRLGFDPNPVRIRLGLIRIRSEFGFDPNPMNPIRSKKKEKETLITFPGSDKQEKNERYLSTFVPVVRLRPFVRFPK